MWEKCTLKAQKEESEFVCWDWMKTRGILSPLKAAEKRHLGFTFKNESDL